MTNPGCPTSKWQFQEDRQSKQSSGRNSSMKFPWPKGQVSPGSCSGLDRLAGTCRGGKFSLSGSLTSERQKWPSLPRQPPPAQGCSLPLGGHGQHLCTGLSLGTAWSPLAAWEIVNEKWVCELLSLTPPGINTSLLSFSSLAPTGLTRHYFAHRVRIWAKSSRPCLCSSVLFILRIPCRLLTTDSIPTTKWHGRGQGSGLVGFFTAFPGEMRGSGQHIFASSPHGAVLTSWADGTGLWDLWGKALIWFISVSPNPAQPKARPWHSKYLVNTYRLSFTFSTTRTPISPQRIR